MGTVLCLGPCITLFCSYGRFCALRYRFRIPGTMLRLWPSITAFCSGHFHLCALRYSVSQSQTLYFTFSEITAFYSIEHQSLCASRYSASQSVTGRSANIRITGFSIISIVVFAFCGTVFRSRMHFTYWAWRDSVSQYWAL